MTLALESIARTSLVILILLVALRVLRGQPAALRHWVLAAGLVLAAAQPALHSVMPGWSVPALMSRQIIVDHRPAAAVGSPTTLSVIPDSESPAAPASPASLRGAASETPSRPLIWIWVAGAVIGLAAMMIGAIWLARLGRRGKPAGEEWTRVAEQVRQQLGLTRPVRLLITEHPALLVTWGVLRPVVLLPAAAASWPADRIHAVVAHELAHIARRDWPIQMLAESLRAINWFNPLFWIACARLRRESEHACDDTVLDLGIDRTAYAGQLVELARAFSVHGRTWLPAPPMARPSTLERRILAMLNSRMNRSQVSVTQRAIFVALMFAIALPIAAATQAPAGASGTVTDPSGLPLPDATVRLAPIGGGPAIETRSDGAGVFQFASVPAGEYMLSARSMGFSTQRQRLRISGPVTFQLRMQVGTLSENVTVRGGPQQDSGSDSPALPLPPAPVCGATSVGGNLKPPMKLRDVRPRYREEWLQSGLEGNILMQVRIGTDGRVRNVEVVSPSHQELEDEALAAVAQWEFSPTYLNCEAVEVRMFVTVSFKAEQ